MGLEVSMKTNRANYYHNKKLPVKTAISGRAIQAMADLTFEPVEIAQGISYVMGLLRRDPLLNELEDEIFSEIQRLKYRGRRYHSRRR